MKKDKININIENSYQFVEKPDFKTNTELKYLIKENNFESIVSNMEEKANIIFKKDVLEFLKIFKTYNNNRHPKSQCFNTNDFKQFNYNSLFHFVYEIFTSTNLTSKEMEIFSFIRKRLIKPHLKDISINFNPELEKKFEHFFFKFEDYLEIEKKPMKNLMFFFNIYIQNINTELAFCSNYNNNIENKENLQKNFNYNSENSFIIIFRRLESFFTFISNICDKMNKKLQKLGILSQLEKLAQILLGKSYLLLYNFTYIYLINKTKPKDYQIFISAFESFIMPSYKNGKSNINEFFDNSSYDNKKNQKKIHKINQNLNNNNSSKQVNPLTISKTFEEKTLNVDLIYLNNKNNFFDNFNNVNYINDKSQYEFINSAFTFSPKIEESNFYQTSQSKSYDQNFIKTAKNFIDFNEKEISKNILESILNKIATKDKISLYEKNIEKMVLNNKNSNSGRFGLCIICEKKADFFIAKKYIPICGFECKKQYLINRIFFKINDSFIQLVNCKFDKFLEQKKKENLVKDDKCKAFNLEFIEITQINDKYSYIKQSKNESFQTKSSEDGLKVFNKFNNINTPFLNFENYENDFFKLVNLLSNFTINLINRLIEFDISNIKISNNPQISLIMRTLSFIIKFFNKFFPKKIISEEFNNKFIFILLKYFYFGEQIYLDLILDLACEYFIFFNNENKANIKLFLEEGLALLENKQFYTEKRVVGFFNLINKILFFDNESIFTFFKNFDYEENQCDFLKTLIHIYCYNYMDKSSMNNFNIENINIFSNNESYKEPKFFVNQIFDVMSFNLKKISKINGKDTNFMLKLCSNKNFIVNKEKENKKLLKDLFNSNIKIFEEKIKKAFYEKHDIEFIEDEINEDENKLGFPRKKRMFTVHNKKREISDISKITLKTHRKTQIEKDKDKEKIKSISSGNNDDYINEICSEKSHSENTIKDAKENTNFPHSLNSESIFNETLYSSQNLREKDEGFNSLRIPNIKSDAGLFSETINSFKELALNSKAYSSNLNFEDLEIDAWDEKLLKYIAKFLRRQPEIKKTKLGEYIGKNKEFNKKVLKEFINTFNFSGTRIDQALRMLLFTFQIPGEAQIIDRLIEAFSNKYFADIENSSFKNYMENSDSVYYLAYNIMILHTSLHNPKVNKKEKMNKESFQKNLKNLNNGKNFDEEFLSEIFNEVEKSEFINSESSQNFNYNNYLETVKLKIFYFKKEEDWKTISNNELIKISNLILNIVHEKIFKDFDILVNIQNRDHTFLKSLSDVFYNIINIANAFDLEIFKSTIINFWIKLLDFRSFSCINEEKIDLASLYVKFNFKHIHLFEFNLGSFFFFMLEKHYIIERMKEEEKNLYESYSDKISSLNKIFSQQRIEKLINYSTTLKTAHFNSMISVIFQNFNFLIEKKGNFFYRIFQNIVRIIITYEKKDIKSWEIIWKNIFQVFEFLKNEKQQIPNLTHESILKNFIETLIKNYLKNLQLNPKIENEKNLFQLLLYLANNFQNIEFYNFFVLRIFKKIFKDNLNLINKVMCSKIIPMEIKKLSNEKISKELQNDLKNHILKNLEKADISNLNIKNTLYEFNQISFILVVNINILIKIIEELINKKIENTHNQIFFSPIVVINKDVNIGIEDKNEGISKIDIDIASYALIIRILKQFIFYFLKNFYENSFVENDLTLLDTNSKENFINSFAFDYTNLFKYFLTKIINTNNNYLFNEFISEFLNFFLDFPNISKNLIKEDIKKLSNSLNSSIKDDKLSIFNDFILINNLLNLIIETIEFHSKIYVLNSKVLFLLMDIAEIFVKSRNGFLDSTIISIFNLISIFLNNSNLDLNFESEFLMKFFSLFKVLFEIEHDYLDYNYLKAFNFDFNVMENFNKNKSKNIIDKLALLSSQIESDYSLNSKKMFYEVLDKIKNSCFSLIEKFIIFSKITYLDIIKNNLNTEEVSSHFKLENSNSLLKQDIIPIIHFSEKLYLLSDLIFEKLIGEEFMEYFGFIIIHDSIDETQISRIDSLTNNLSSISKITNNEIIFSKKYEKNFNLLIVNLHYLFFYIFLSKFLIKLSIFNMKEDDNNGVSDSSFIQRSYEHLFKKIDIFFKIIFKINEERKFNEFLNVNFRNEFTNYAKILLRSTKSFIVFLLNKPKLIKDKTFLKAIKLTLIDSIVLDSKDIRNELRNLLYTIEKIS